MPTQIVAKLRQADVVLGQGKTVPEVCREIEVSEQTYYRSRHKYGGMSPEMVKELRGLQKENGRLRKLVADQALEDAILREAQTPWLGSLTAALVPDPPSISVEGRHASLKSYGGCTIVTLERLRDAAADRQPDVKRSYYACRNTESDIRRCRCAGA